MDRLFVLCVLDCLCSRITYHLMHVACKPMLCMNGSQFFLLQGEYDLENTTTSSSSSSTFCFHAVIWFLLRAAAPLRFMMDYVTDKIASVSCSTIPRQHDIRQPGRRVVSAHDRLSARYSLPWPDGRIAASPFQVSWAIATEYVCSPLPP